jgi:isoleucyl-tRNA synthetase
MKGFHVERYFGWDTHGVPIEFQIDKALGMSGPVAVKQMGIEKYNAECRSIVLKHASEWKDIVSRMGRWIDFDNGYKVRTTLVPRCMQNT